MDKYLCERCGKELVFRCAYSRIDHKLICIECDDKEQPKELMKKITDLEAKLAEKIQKYQLLDDNYTRLTEKYDLLESRHELLIEENLKLEHQLAEKNEAHTEAMQNALNDFLKLRQELNQEKILFAVEKLEKVKEWFKRNATNDVNNNVVLLDHSYTGVLMLLDGEIEDLKG